MNKPSRLARVSVAFAVVGALAALTRSGWLPVLGMSLGLAAVGVGAAACWSNHRAPAAPRGRGLAVLGTCLGAGVTVLSLFVLLSMLVQQIVQEQRRQTNWHPAVQ